MVDIEGLVQVREITGQTGSIVGTGILGQVVNHIELELPLEQKILVVIFI